MVGECTAHMEIPEIWVGAPISLSFFLEDVELRNRASLPAQGQEDVHVPESLPLKK